MKIIYTSLLTKDFSKEEFDSMLKTFRAKNAENGITGIMFVKDKTVMQLIEGEKEAVLALWKNICKDPNHHHVQMIFESFSEKRLFGEWNMFYEALETTNNGGSEYAVMNENTVIYTILECFKRSGG